MAFDSVIYQTPSGPIGIDRFYYVADHIRSGFGSFEFSDLPGRFVLNSRMSVIKLINKLHLQTI